MGITSSTPSVSNAAGTECEEGGSSLASPNEGPTANGPRRADSGTAVEEDWPSMVTGDPAFWLKD